MQHISYYLLATVFYYSTIFAIAESIRLRTIKNKLDTGLFDWIMGLLFACTGTYFLITAIQGN